VQYAAEGWRGRANFKCSSAMRAVRELVIIFEDHRYAQKQYLDEWGEQRRVFKIVTYYAKVTVTEIVLSDKKEIKETGSPAIALPGLASNVRT